MLFRFVLIIASGLVACVCGMWLALLPDVSGLLWLRALCAGTGGVTAALLSALIAQRFTPRKQRTSYGSAGFASQEEKASLLFDVAALLPPGAILLGAENNNRVALAPPYTTQHGVIVGGSGTGKSFSFFLPNIANAASSGVSCVATDPKSELWRYTSGFHNRATRYAPTEPEASSVGFNWIPLCADARMAALCARTIVEAGETTRQEAPWPDLETAFLAALFSHTSTLAVPTPLSAYQLLTRTEPNLLMEQFLMSASWVAREQAVIFQQTHERMRGSITPVLAAKLQFMRDPRVARFTSSNFAAPDLGRLRASPEAVYWCVPEQDMALLRGLSALFFTVLLDQLAREPAAGPDGKPGAPIPVHLYLDEFANIGIIPHYETTISLARGRGLSIWHGLQSLSQLEARYGKPNAQTILTNCATKIALSGLDVETATYFSRSLGEATLSVYRPSWSRRRFALFASSVSVSDQEHARLLLTADEVRRIGEEQALVITGNRRPLLINKSWYHNLPNPQKGSSGVPGGLGEARCSSAAAATMPLPSSSQPLSSPLPPPLRKKHEKKPLGNPPDLPSFPPPVFKMKPMQARNKGRMRPQRTVLITGRRLSPTSPDATD